MIDLHQIQAPVSDFIESFHQEFDQALESQSKWIAQAIEALKRSTGKQVRPLLVGLMSGCCGVRPSTEALEAAVLLELIHTATLIHDDVIDSANTRRGVPTLNAIFDNRVSVLIGDFVLSSALERALQIGNLRILGIVTDLGKNLSEGEIRQFETAEEVVLSEEIYMDIIGQKTASLFRAACEVAAITAKAEPSLLDRCVRIGTLLGYAFQIRDDIFDYYTQDVGKPTGNDIREGKITLPLLYALTSTKGEDREACMCVLAKKKFDTKDLNMLTNYAIQNGGIAYAQAKMQELSDRACLLLDEFEPSSSREAMKNLTAFICHRSV